VHSHNGCETGEIALRAIESVGDFQLQLLTFLKFIGMVGH